MGLHIKEELIFFLTFERSFMSMIDIYPTHIV